MDSLNGWESCSLESGGFGTTFKIQKDQLQLVMKELFREPNQEDQHKEMRILKKVVHRNIVKYKDRPHDFPQKPGKYLIFMEYCERGSLRNVIKNSTINYSVASIVKWAEEIFSALVYLKSDLIAIAHRDIKPDNIFVTQDFTLKLGDFGVIKRFDGNDMNTFAGTPKYMAPEISLGINLSFKEVQKCDVFGAGLTLWELIERKDLPSDLIFTPTICPNVKLLYDLVLKCSSEKIDLEKRYDAEMGLDKTKGLKELFPNFRPEPESKPRQDRLKIPDGLCLVKDSENLENWKIPTITFGETVDKNKKNKEERPETSKPKIDPENEELWLEYMEKLDLKTDFQKMTVTRLPENDPMSLHKPLGYENLELGYFRQVIYDVNDVRSSLIDWFLSAFKWEALSNVEKKQLLEGTARIQQWTGDNFFSKKHRDVHCVLNEYAEEMEIVEPIVSALQSFAWVVSQDFYYQDFCVEFSVATLWNCQSLKLSWVELIDLLDIAIHNIQEVEKVFTRRKLYDTYYVGDSRNEWCKISWAGLAFTRDLREIQIYDQVRKEVFEPESQSKTTIDIDKIRRVLIEKRDQVIAYSKVEAKKPWKFDEESQKFIDSVILSIKFDQSEEFQEWNWKLDENPFLDYIYFWDSLPKDKIFEKCSCLEPCPVENFPKLSLDHSLPQIKYSTCKKLNQLQFLEIHSLFERSFRLLHHWENIHRYRITHLYLLETLLREICSKDLSRGFHFWSCKERAWLVKPVYVGEDQRFCPSDDLNGEETVRSGLLIGLNPPYTNTFFHREFRLESAAHSCKMEFAGLVYICLEDLRQLLDIMCEFVRRSDAISPDPIRIYRERMQEAIERFWNARGTI